VEDAQRCVFVFSHYSYVFAVNFVVKFAVFVRTFVRKSDEKLFLWWLGCCFSSW
jgi:hypothetical protein